MPDIPAKPKTRRNPINDPRFGLAAITGDPLLDNPVLAPVNLDGPTAPAITGTIAARGKTLGYAGGDPLGELSATRAEQFTQSSNTLHAQGARRRQADPAHMARLEGARDERIAAKRGVSNDYITESIRIGQEQTDQRLERDDLRARALTDEEAYDIAGGGVGGILAKANFAQRNTNGRRDRNTRRNDLTAAALSRAEIGLAQDRYDFEQGIVKDNRASELHALRMNDAVDGQRQDLYDFEQGIVKDGRASELHDLKMRRGEVDLNDALAGPGPLEMQTVEGYGDVLTQNGQYVSTPKADAQAVETQLEVTEQDGVKYYRTGNDGRYTPVPGQGGQAMKPADLMMYRMTLQQSGFNPEEIKAEILRVSGGGQAPTATKSAPAANAKPATGAEIRESFFN